MTFAFDFTSDDIEIDNSDNLATKLESTNINAAVISSSVLIAPKRHSFADLLKSLPSQISYNTVDVHYTVAPNGDNKGRLRTVCLKVPRRAIFDIQQQLMHEADPEASDTGNLLAGLRTGDLTTGIYEGGFKTWECAMDLAHHAVAEYESMFNDTNDGVHVVELGAGSAIPSLALLRRILQERQSRGDREKGQKVRLTVCDYNEDVLRLGTAVNTFLSTWLELCTEEPEDEGDVEIDDDSCQLVSKLLKDANVEIEFISGAWGPDFIDLLKTPDQNSSRANVVLLASETIYSPSSLGVFSDTVLEMLRRDTMSGRRAKAYIAAKKVYFGVGGGLQEFKEEIEKRGGSLLTVVDGREEGVGRVLVEVRDTEGQNAYET